MAKKRRDRSGGLVEVACASSRPEAELIEGLLKTGGIPSVLQSIGVNGPQLGYGLLPTNPQRVMVRAHQAQAASALLASRVAEGQEDASPEIANPRYVARASGRGPRNYGVLGAFARGYLWSIGIVAVAFGIFLLLRAG